MILSPESVIKVYRSGVSLVNLLFYTNYDSSNTANSFIYPVYVLEKKIIFDHWIFKTQGSVMNSFTALDWDMTNSIVDMQRNFEGFRITFSWDGINEVYLTTIKWKNVTLTFSGGKTIDTMFEREMILIWAYTSHIMEDIYYDTYKGYTSQMPGIVSVGDINQLCPPNLDRVVYTNITNVYLDLGENRPGGTYSNANVIFIGYRTSIIATSISINNLTFVGGYDNAFSTLNVNSLSPIDSEIKNLNFINVTSEIYGIVAQVPHNLTFTNLKFENCTSSDSPFAFISAAYVEVNHLQLIDSVVSSTTSSSLISFQSTIGTKVDNVEIYSKTR
jgi:hypothetical protein